jgi:hypothetical protein
MFRRTNGWLDSINRPRTRRRPRPPRGWQGLEGSRFGAYPATLATFVSSLVPPKRTKTGGSRERPIGWQLYDLGINESKALGECIAQGNSREPPVATLFWPDGALKTNIARSSDTRQSGSPPGAGQ